MALNLRQMEVFRAVMKSGSVTAAAKALNVSQPSVSEILRYSEQRLGFQLFDRSGGRLKPTDAANRLFTGVERVFDEVARVNRTAMDLREAHRTSLRIGSISALAMTLGPMLVAEFQRLAPRANVRLSVLKRGEMAQDLIAEQLEIGLTFLSEDFAGLSIVEIARRPLQCVVPIGHVLDRDEPVTLAQVAEHPLIGYDPRLTTAQLLKRIFAEASVPYRPVCEVEQVLQAWSLVQSGIGICLIEPFSSMGPFFPGARVVPLVCSATVPLQLLVAEGNPEWSMVEAFVAHAQQIVSQMP